MGLTQPQPNILRYAIISFTRDLAAITGNVAYTGVGFRPSILLFLCAMSAGAANVVSIGGVVPAVSSFSINQGASTTWSPYNNPIHLEISAGNFQEASVASVDADGFTLTWTKTLIPAGIAQCYAICLALQ